MTGPGVAARPRVGLTGFWADPRDPGILKGIPHNLARSLEALGVYAGYREAFPYGRAAAAVHGWTRLRRGGGAWLLGPEMRLLTAASEWRRRATTPDTVDAWITMGTARTSRGRVATLSDESPYQFFHRSPTPAARHWAPEASDKMLARAERRADRLYRSAYVCCAASHWAALSLERDDGIDRGRIRVVGLGCGANFDPSAVRADRDWARPRFLFVGGDWARKNGDAIVSAFVRLQREHPDATLDLVGDHPRLSLDGVTAHGALDRRHPTQKQRLDALLGRATCFVMPSLVEPFGHVYVEAASVGVPSIATSVGGAREAVGPGGVIVDPNDGDAITAAMLRLAAPSEARSLGAVARQHAGLLTWDAIARRVLRALDLHLPDLEPPEFL